MAKDIYLFTNVAKIKKELFLPIVIAELILIVLITVQVINKKNTRSEVKSVNPIKGTSVEKVSGSYEYYYEPVADTNDVVNDWVSDITYPINSDTLHERYEYSTEKPQDTYRIVALGDSWTYGLYVDTKNNWVEKLEDKLNSSTCDANIKKFEVLNLGVHGYDIAYSAERFYARGVKYNPDMVIWLIKSDDLYQLNELLIPKERKIQAEMKESGEWQLYIDNNELYPSWKKAFDEVIKEVGGLNIINQQKDILKNFAKNYDGPVVLVTLNESETLTGLFGDAKAAVEQTVHEHDNLYFNSNITNTSSSKGTSIPGDSHPNVAGHNLIASQVLNYLKSQFLTSCK